MLICWTRYFIPNDMNDQVENVVRIFAVLLNNMKITEFYSSEHV